MTSSITQWIIDHRKFFITTWFVIAVVMISPALSSIDEMDVTMEQMDPDFSKTNEYISHYFDKAELDYYRIPVIVINYWDEEGYRQISGDSFVDPLPQYIRESFIADEKWDYLYDNIIDEIIGTKYDSIIDVAQNGDDKKGAVVIGILLPERMSDEDIYCIIPELRSSVNGYVDDYMYDLFEHDRHFNVNLTGNIASSYDVSDEFDKYLTVAIIAALVFVVLMMGLFFGSISTSLISVFSMSASAIITMAAMYLITDAFSIPYVVMIIVLLLVLIISFAHSILTFSFYRNELMNGKDKDEALKDVIVRTSIMFIPFSICIAICCIVLIVTGSPFLFIFGLCALVGLAVVFLVSSTLTISLMNLTKNELLWKRNEKGIIKWEPVRKINSSVENFFSKVSEVTGRHSKKSLIAIASVLVILIAGSIGYIVANDSFGNASYDAVISSGESKNGINALEENSMGGLCQPYQIIISYSDPIAHLDIVNISGTDLNVIEMYWDNPDFSAYREICSLENRIRTSFSDDVYSVSSMECWDALVKDVKTQYPSAHALEIIDKVLENLRRTNMPAAYALEKEIDSQFVRLALEHPLLDREWLAYCIVDNIDCTYGPMFDYSMNHATGTIGYHMNSAGDVVVDRVMMNVSMSHTATSTKSMNAADRIYSAVEGFVYYNSDSMDDCMAMGTSESCNNITRNIESKATFIAAIVCLLVLLATAIIERKMIFTIAGIVLSISGFVISAGVTFVVMNAFNMGSAFFLMPLMMLLTCIIISTWFGFMQSTEAKYNNDVRTMKRCVDPIIIITSGSVIVFAVAMVFSDISFINQSALMLVVSVLIQGLIMRIVISPHLWAMARADLPKIKIGLE